MVHVAYADTEAKKGSSLVKTADQISGVPLIAARAGLRKTPRVLAVKKTRALPETGVGTSLLLGVLMLGGALLVVRSLRGAR
jgi:hypothetical protein